MSDRRQHEPLGTRVEVIRHTHGWEDGDITGVIVGIDGHAARVRIDGREGVVICEHRRDYRVAK